MSEEKRLVCPVCGEDFGPWIDIPALMAEVERENSPWEQLDLFPEDEEDGDPV